MNGKNKGTLSNLNSTKMQGEKDKDSRSNILFVINMQNYSDESNSA